MTQQQAQMIRLLNNADTALTDQIYLAALAIIDTAPGVQARLAVQASFDPLTQ